MFIEEQKVSKALEKDVFDDQAHHLLAYDKAIPVTTGKFFRDGYHFKLGRICILKPYRGMELGRSLMERMVERAEEEGIEKLYLYSQVNGIGSFKKFGSMEYGDVFDDAGIEHISMVKNCRSLFLSEKLE